MSTVRVVDRLTIGPDSRNNVVGPLLGLGSQIGSTAAVGGWPLLE
ncbi:hypothetical protein [Stutzerimonas zhaodongensis]|nr:hypothetical protein [Stutzerimonas zhaodongensis]